MCGTDPVVSSFVYSAQAMCRRVRKKLLSWLSGEEKFVVHRNLDLASRRTVKGGRAWSEGDLADVANP